MPSPACRVGKWVSLGVKEFGAAKNAKFAKAVTPKLETRNSKPEADQPTGETFCRRGAMHGEEGAGES